MKTINEYIDDLKAFKAELAKIESTPVADFENKAETVQLFGARLSAEEAKQDAINYQLMLIAGAHSSIDIIIEQEIKYSAQ